jgi:hypothetical protein
MDVKNVNPTRPDLHLNRCYLYSLQKAKSLAERQTFCTKKQEN